MRSSITTCLVLYLGLAGCAEDPQAPCPCPCAERELRVATTTSLDNSGLLEELLPIFEARTGISVHLLAVGTGQALELGRRGDVDLLLVHDPASELEFVEQGYGLDRIPLMVNDFLVVGPADDPAGVGGLEDAGAALHGIAESGASFASRGDHSGTHRAELRLWSEPPPSWEGYLEVGQGMRATLTLADQRGAYCLVDRGTWLDAAPDLSLVPLVQGDPRLLNPYHAIAVHPGRHPHARTSEALALVGWLISAEGQQRIGAYQRAGQTLFEPATWSTP